MATNADPVGSYEKAMKALVQGKTDVQDLPHDATQLKGLVVHLVGGTRKLQRDLDASYKSNNRLSESTNTRKQIPYLQVPKLRSHEKENDKLNSKIDSQEEIMQLKTKFSEQNAPREKAKQIKAQEEEVKTLDARLKHELKCTESLNAEQGKTEKRITDLRSQMISFETQLNGKNKELKQGISQSDKKNTDEKSQMKRRLDEIEKENKKLKEQIKKKTNQSALEEKEGGIPNIKFSADDRNRIISSLKEELEALRDEHEKLEDANERQISEIKILEQDLAEEKATLGLEKLNLKRTITSLQDCMKQVNDIQKQLDIKDEEVRQVSSDLEQLKKQHSIETENIRKKLDESNTKLHMLSQKKTELERKLEIKETEWRGKDNNLDCLVSEKTKMSEACGRLEVHVAENEENIKSVKSTLAVVCREKDAVHSELAVRETEIGKLSEQLKTLSEENKEIKIQNKDFIRQLKQKINEHESSTLHAKAPKSSENDSRIDNCDADKTDNRLPEHTGNHNSEEDDTIDSGVQTIPFDEGLIDSIIECIPAKAYESLGIVLGFKASQLSHFEHNHQRDIEGQIRAMLRMWKNKEGEEATTSRFLTLIEDENVCEKIDRDDIKKAIMNYIRKKC